MRLSLIGRLSARMLVVCAGAALLLIGWQRFEPQTVPEWVPDVMAHVAGRAAAATRLTNLVSFKTGGEATVYPGDSVHIAVAVDGAKTDGPGKGIVNAVRLYFEEINHQGGVAGHEVIVDVYDDEGTPDRAREVAAQIANDSVAVAVIGHRLSDTSIAAGDAYRENRIPAITPTSTHPAVTRDNDWYFRAVYSDDRIGRYIAHYVYHVLRPEMTILVQGEHEYGRTLAQVFRDGAMDLELALAGAPLTTSGTSANQREEAVARLLATLASVQGDSVVFLATYPDEAVDLIRAVREADMRNVVFVAPDSFDRSDFVTNFENLGLEQRSPGYYTDGIHIATPMIFDTASREAGLFRNAYIRRFGSTPDWRAAFAYDAAQAIIRSIERAATEDPTTVRNARHAIKQQLALMNTVQTGFAGITGPVFFNDQGSATRPAAFGRYEGRQFVSALTQFQTLDQIGHRANIRDLVQAGRVISINGHLMKPTDVAFVGVEAETFDDISMDEHQLEITGKIWFRYDPLHDDIDPSDIEFLNAAGPVEMKMTADHASADGNVYKRFNFRGRFRVDFISSLRRYQQPIVGLSFRHRRLPSSELIYVADLGGLGLASNVPIGRNLDALTPQIERLGWRPGEHLFYQDTNWVRTLGDPMHMDAPDGAIPFSVFVVAARLVPIGTIGDTLVPAALTHRVLLWSGAVILLTVLLAVIRWRAMIGLTLLLAQFLAVRALLWAGERMLTTVRSDAIPSQHFDTVARLFESAWWLIPALYLIVALGRYAWPTLERRTGRRVPRMIKGICALVILLFAVFGVVAFVYDQPLTSLLATSGLVGLILGLAAQTNLSNVFSGITLSVERPFAIGDVIELEGHGLTKVTDMTWRSTRLVTPDSEEISVPNSAVADSFVRNYSKADAIKNSLCVRLPPSVDKSTAVQVITKAIAESAKISPDHPHGIEYGGVQPWERRLFAEYHAWYYLKDNFGRWPASCDVWEHIWKALTEAGIAEHLDSPPPPALDPTHETNLSQPRHEHTDEVPPVPPALPHAQDV